MGITVNAGKMPIFQRIRQGGLKSREEKLERQQNRDNQVAVLEKQKANLKNMECGSLEEIEDKLELLHSYEDQIKAVKQAYNNEQIHHILDEAREKGEKIAEELKKLAPKTEEERKEALLEETMGIEEDSGLLEELMEDLTEELAEEITEELEEKTTENFIEEVAEELAEETVKDITEETAEELTGQLTAEIQEQVAKESEYSDMEEILAMHGKARVEIDRYLDYYKYI